MSSDRMSRTEAMMWTVEKDPSLRSDFLNVTLLDRPPDHDRLRGKVVEALDALPRLRQRVVNAPLRLVPPEWVDDPELDLDYHLRRVAVPAPGSLRQLLDLAATLSALPFDRARPLWDLTVVEGLEGGRAAFLQKIHHTVIDGVGGVRFSTALLDLERDPPDAPTAGPHAAPGPPTERRTPSGVLAGAVADLAREQLSTARRALERTERALRRPEELARVPERAARAARSVRDQVMVRGEALSPAMRRRSPARRFDTFSVPLDEVRALAERLGGSVNDAFVTGVAGAFGRYHERMGHPVDELRMAMPVNLRGEEEGVAGNRFAPARVVVPVTPKEPASLFRAVHERLHGIRSEPAFDLVEPVAAVAGLAPTSLIVPMTRAQARTIDFVCSNVRGAPFDLYLAGARVESNHPMGPCLGAGANVTTLSYRGNLDMGVNVDAAAVTDPEALLRCLTESFEELLAAGH